MAVQPLATYSFPTNLDLSKPRWDQSTYAGRARHFFNVCDPTTAFATPSQLDTSKEIVNAYRNKNWNNPALNGLTGEDIWKSKKLYDSAFHPDTGEKLFVIGRMSFQVPGNMIIIGGMLTFYKGFWPVVFWQVINQSFNATVNYTNRNASSEVSRNTLIASYCAATSAAVGTALGFNHLIAKSGLKEGSILGRWVPMVAIAAANCCNIPLMRNTELQNGITIFDQEGNELGKSKIAAKTSIIQVIISRISMAAPAAVIPPMIMQQLEKKPFLQARPWMSGPLTCLLVGLNLVVSTPLACAFFPQQSVVSTKTLEPEFHNLGIDYAVYNKGL